MISFAYSHHLSQVIQPGRQKSYKKYEKEPLFINGSHILKD